MRKGDIFGKVILLRSTEIPVLGKFSAGIFRHLCLTVFYMIKVTFKSTNILTLYFFNVSDSLVTTLQVTRDFALNFILFEDYK